MKTILLLMLIVSMLVIPSAYAQEPKIFGYKIMPEKMVEGTEGVLQIYGLQNSVLYPNTIQNLIVTSSDQNIIKISNVIENGNNFITSIQLQSINSGTANIAIAAPGFTSEEFPITVYDVKQSEQQLLVKIVPDKFTIDGPTKGYFSVELADVDSNPTLAKADMKISILTSNSDVVTISSNQLTINQGEYFVVGEFEVKSSGDVILFAENETIKSDSSTITVTENNDPMIQLYVIPNKISNLVSTNSFAIVQLRDSSGQPVQSEKDIHVSLNVSHEKAQFNDQRISNIGAPDTITIPKGSSYGYAKLGIIAGLVDTFDVHISAEDYEVSASEKLEVVMTDIIHDPTTKFETIPFTFTGHEEPIGVLYSINRDDVAILNSITLETQFDSSSDELSISDVRLDKGIGAKLVFGKSGYVKPDTLEITVIENEKNIYFPTIFGSTKTELKLHSDPIISKVLPLSEFPIVLYFTDNSNSNWFFPDTANTFMSPNEFVKINTITVTEGKSNAILNGQSIKEGKATLSFEIGDYKTNLDLDTTTIKPSLLELTYSQHLLSGMKNTVSIQILDESNNPMFANHDMEFTIVADDGSVKLPEKVIIKKGTYHTLFDLMPQQSGDIEIAILATDFPLSKFVLNSIETKPSLIISTVNSIDVGSTFDVVVDVKIANTPLSDIEINWNIQGAEIQEIQEITDQNGKVKITLTAQDPESILIEVNTSEFGNLITTTREIVINQAIDISQESTGTFGFDNIGLGLILLPGVVIGSGILIRKKNLLEPVSDRFPIVERVLTKFNDLFERLDLTDKISEIKERIPIIKDR